MSLRYSFFLLISILIACSSPEKEANPKEVLADQMEKHLKTEVLDYWYPNAMDTIDGGFLSNFSHDFKPEKSQEKMVVTQARQVWTNSKASLKYPEIDYYKDGAKHGYEFLRKKMWDSK